MATLRYALSLQRSHSAFVKHFDAELPDYSPCCRFALMYLSRPNAICLLALRLLSTSYPARRATCDGRRQRVFYFRTECRTNVSFIKSIAAASRSPHTTRFDEWLLLTSLLGSRSKKRALSNP